MELEKLEAETTIKLFQLELQSSSASVVIVTTEAPVTVSLFDFNKNNWLVPVFSDTNVDTYFVMFECIASLLHWPQHVCGIMLQLRLTGQAQEICYALSSSTTTLAVEMSWLTV